MGLVKCKGNKSCIFSLTQATKQATNKQNTKRKKKKAWMRNDKQIVNKNSIKPKLRCIIWTRRKQQRDEQTKIKASIFCFGNKQKAFQRKPSKYDSMTTL